MNTWRTTGSTALTPAPRPLLSVGNIAPAEQRLAFRRDTLVDVAFTTHAAVDIARQEHHADAIIASDGQRDREISANPTQKRIGRLNEYAGAIAHQTICAGGAAMGEVFKNLQALHDQRMTLLTFDVRDKTHSARIMLVRTGHISLVVKVAPDAPRNTSIRCS